MSQVKLIKDIKDANGGILATAGTIVNFISDEGDYIIVELADGSVSFPVDPDEYTELAETNN